jgi:hypothetical protein
VFFPTEDIVMFFSFNSGEIWIAVPGRTQQNKEVIWTLFVYAGDAVLIDGSKMIAGSYTMLCRWLTTVVNEESSGAHPSNGGTIGSSIHVGAVSGPNREFSDNKP